MFPTSSSSWIREDDRSGKEAKVNYGLWQEGNKE